MTHQAPFPSAAPGADPGRQVAQLREALRLVERIAGRSDAAAGDARLDEAARVSAAYDRALPIVQRRFDALAGEATAWAAAGVEALLAAAGTSAPRAAAARLAARIDGALVEMAGLLADADH
ncbi:hypothetical protein [Sphingosinicella sp. CPCC 101087]|uniref:hypothetical protein n=1 Tax=Sphingosinicella sp. CPCC 101087 TaxID=2497754 RepID=UPI00101C5667|nr:hypothetical protein [Sphingosinicella sp. CPCC 101087]